MSPNLAPDQAVVANGSGCSLLIGTRNQLPRLHVMDTRDLGNTESPLVFIDLTSPPNHVSIASGIGFVADGTAGIQVINYLAFDNRGVPPTVTLSASFALNSSTNGTAEEGKLVRVSAATSDRVEVRDVEFYVDGVQVGRDVSFPFEHRFVTPRLSQTNFFRVRAKATDTDGNSAWSDEMLVDISQDASAPVVTGVFPLNNQIAASQIVVAAYFNEPISLSSLNGATFGLQSAGFNGLLSDADDETVTNAVLGYTDEANAATLRLDARSVGLFRATLRPPLSDRAGNELANAVTWQFRILGTTTIAGAARHEDGNPAPSLPITIRSGTNIYSTVTLADGSFVVAGVTIGWGPVSISAQWSSGGSLFVGLVSVLGDAAGLTDIGTLNLRSKPLVRQTLAAGYAHAVALQTNGTSWAWGFNIDG